MRFPTPLTASLFLALVLCLPAGMETRADSWPHERAQTPQSLARAAAERMQRLGLPNFGNVSQQLQRGAQPKDTGFAELKKLGIDIVVNLRHESDQIARERTLVEAQGMRYVSIPWRGKQDPRTEQVAQFLGLLRENADRKVFVHCERGAERTGVFVACYRMSSEQWTPEQALSEMATFHFRRLRFGHLQRFVRAFPVQLTRDPVLKALTRPDSGP